MADSTNNKGTDAALLETAPPKQIIEQIKSRNQTAFVKLIQMHEQDIERFVESKFHHPSDTDEILQRTFYTVWKKIDQLKDCEKVKSWIIAIADSCGREHLKSETKPSRIPPKQQVSIEEGDEVTDQHDILCLDAMVHAEEKILMTKALETLTKDEYDTYYKRVAEGLSYDKIAKAQDISVRQVKAKLINIQMKLSQFVEGSLCLVPPLLNKNLSAPLRKTMEIINNDHAAQSTAAATVTASSWSSSWALNAFNPFLLLAWFCSLVWSAFALGSSLVDNAPAIQIRRWHVRNNFILYNIAIIGFLFPLCVIVTLPHRLNDIFYNTYSVCYAIFACAFLLRAIFQYAQITSPHKPRPFSISFPSLSKLVNKGFLWNSPVVLVILTWITIWPIFWENVSVANFLTILAFGLCVLCYHFFAYRQFQRFLRLSGDGVVFDPQLGKVRNRRSEYYFLTLGVLFTVGPNLARIIANPYSSFCAICEVILYGSLWCYVIRSNRKADTHSYLRITAMLFVQIGMMVFARLVIY